MGNISVTPECRLSMVAPQPTFDTERHRGADRLSPIEYLEQSRPVNDQLGSRLARLQVHGCFHDRQNWTRAEIRTVRGSAGWI
jgi:hypothetical protein